MAYLIKHRNSKIGPLCMSIVVINDDKSIEEIVENRELGFGSIIEEVRPLTEGNYTIHLN